MPLAPILHSLLLLTLANGAPVIAKKIFGARWAAPLDCGALFFDGQPIFGTSKTIRGVVAAVLATSIGAPFVGLGYDLGAQVAILAMAGDLFSSFLKRRLRMPPSSQATGLDQVPESLFPLLVCSDRLSLDISGIVAVVLLFFVGEIVVSRVLHVLRVRDQPY